MTSRETVDRAAAFERRLKRAAGKGSGHTIRNVDFIYMINLDTRPEKFALASRFLEVYGVTPYRFPAVDGWQLSKEAVQDVGLQWQPGMTSLLATRYPTEIDEMLQSHELTTEPGRTYFVHCMALGTIGCALSHISVLQDAWDAGYETIWVMEDDIEVLGDPHALSSLIDELDVLVGRDGWDVLFTDVDYRCGVGRYELAHGAAKRPDMDCSPAERFSEKYAQTVRVSDRLRRIGARFGATSRVVRRSGIGKLLEFFKAHHIYLPFDLDDIFPPGMRRYGLTFDLVTNLLGSLSDNGARTTLDGGRVESFLQTYPEVAAQDIVWGRSIYQLGTDRCDERYRLLTPVLDRLDGPFSVLDAHAAQGYFSLRIAAGYPQSACVMTEADDASRQARDGARLADLCRANGELTNLVFLNMRLGVDDLAALAADEHFDLVLARLAAPTTQDWAASGKWLDLLLDLGDQAVVEIAGPWGSAQASCVDRLAARGTVRPLGQVRRFKDPRADGTLRLFWFSHAGDRTRVDPSVPRLFPIRKSTFNRLNGMHPSGYEPRCL